jgi:hypothetical protein
MEAFGIFQGCPHVLVSMLLVCWGLSYELARSVMDVD